MSNVRSTTQPAPVLEGYPEPEQQLHRDRVAAQMRKLPKVDGQGFVISKGPDPSVTNVVEPGAPAQAPTMVDALAHAAKAIGAEDQLPTLLDSNAFRAAIATTSPSDQVGLVQVIRDHLPAPALPGMQPDAAQHRIGASVPSPGSRTLLERIQKETEKHLSQPPPPGSTYRG